ncbi:MAG: sortase [Candidatus Pacebacteria bacterium]|nr:sortase [Candidatus Paceibacterota bacterium]
MTPENLPTMSIENETNNNYQGDWWLLKKYYQYTGTSNFGKNIKNWPLVNKWKLSFSTTILLLLVIIGSVYSYRNTATITSIFPTTSQYAVATIQSTKFIPNFFQKLEVITDKFDLTAAMIYLKKISTKDDGNTITIIEGNEEITLEKPLRLTISKIGVSTIVTNPVNKDLETLNNSLELGAVRYPGSGLLGENKNIFIFGHSTSLETDNAYYKTFNNLETLEKGDEIIVESLNNQYVYKVTSVKKTNTANGAIQIDSQTQKLTISTCNTLGAKEDRYVVEADFVKVTPLVNTNNEENTPNIGGNIHSPYPINPTPGETEENEYIIDPIINPVIDYGLVDLEVTIDSVGYLNSNKDLVATSTLSLGDIGAVKFTVTNIGTHSSDGWTFNAVLPTSPAHIFHSQGQKTLAPGEKIEFTMGFDKLRVGDQMPVVINIDPSGGMKESNKVNNIAKVFIDIIEN